MIFRFRKPTLHCSFCGKPSEQVGALVAGPRVHICDECIGLCVACLPLRSRLNAFATAFSPRKWRFGRAESREDPAKP